MKLIEYNITPAKGQALLNFQGRRLPEKITLFETKLIEEVRPSKNGQQSIKTDEIELNKDFTNLLIHGDVLSTCAYLKDKDIKVDLVYIDPPFASGANYAKKIYLRNGNKTEFENSNVIGEEVMYGDIWQKEDYLNWLYERLLAIKEIMSETASIYVHLDWHIGHYAKILLDEIFGEENMVNEIIWHYTGNSIPTKSFQKKHDVIFMYAKDVEFTLNLDNVLLPYSEGTLKRYNHVDENGNRYKISSLIPGSKEQVYAKEGKIPDSVWEIPLVRQVSEKVDYATQKPEKLLERRNDSSRFFWR